MRLFAPIGSRGVVGLWLALLPLAAWAARETHAVEVGWRFSLGDPVGAAQAEFDDTTWRRLDLPHDWSIEGDYSREHPTGNRGAWLPGGIGWYRREIEMPTAWRGQRVSIEFEGVYMASEVWLNGARVGGRPYGYSSFACDLTPHLRPGRNVLAVRVDNSLEPSARWYHGAGIYGHVWLHVTDPIHIPHDGVFIKTPDINATEARVVASIEVRNDRATPVATTVETEIFAPDGRSLARASTEASLPAGTIAIVTPTLTVTSPALWSPATPTLHRLRTRVIVDGRAVDEVETSFGIRTLKFDPDHGLFINGAPVKLKGVCEHQGASPVGAAIPEALLERRLRQLLAMGCNSIRAAHNPQLPAFYDLCDRLGILVMDEIFDGWHQKADHDYGARFFADWWQRDVTDWVRRDRNHPSVIFWSIGNETGRKDTLGIAALIRQLDDTRPTTGGAVTDGVDVAGFNGMLLRTANTLDQFHRTHPTQPIVLTEEPHTFQTRGYYQTSNSIFNPLDPLPDYATPEVFPAGPEAYRSSYDNCGRRLVARNCWRRTLERPWVIGEYRWTGFDYLGESAWAGEESLARAFNFGVIDLAGFPKDHYFLYQSLWSETPMVHLLPHWTHPGLEGKTIPVVAYANADEVELFQDGRSLGRQHRSDLFECVWSVPYRPGELRAVAYRAGQPVAESVQRTADAPARLNVTTDNAALQPARGDVALVTLAVTDEAGTLAPNADDVVAITALGPARWLGGENGDPIDLTPQRATSRRVFHGLSRGFYAGLDHTPGAIEVFALAALGETYFAETTAVTLTSGRVALRGELATIPTEIRYTTDGSAPTSRSALYHEPLRLAATTTVRATAFRGEAPVASVTSTFTRGARPGRPAPSGPRGDTLSAEDPINTPSPRQN